MRNSKEKHTGTYINLEKFSGADNQPLKVLEALNTPDCDYLFNTNQKLFGDIPGCPVAFWLKPSIAELFTDGELLSKYADLRQGLITGDNERFLRIWTECNVGTISTNNSPAKWYFYHKGGEYRKWFGNNALVVNWEHDGYEITNFRDDKGKLRSRPQNIKYYLKEGFTWTALTVADFNVRYMPTGGIFDAKGSSGFSHKLDDLNYIMALCNSKVAMQFLSFLAPTMDYSAGAIGKLPIIISNENKEKIDELVVNNIEVSSTDWNAFEISNMRVRTEKYW